LKALEQHGNDWKNMPSMIPTRTLMQIRTHAQKYLKKQAKVQKKQDGVEDAELSQAQAHGAQRHNQVGSGSAQSSGQSIGSVSQGVMGPAVTNLRSLVSTSRGNGDDVWEGSMSGSDTARVATKDGELTVKLEGSQHPATTRVDEDDELELPCVVVESRASLSTVNVDSDGEQ
jgi:hypothetical protein